VVLATYPATEPLNLPHGQHRRPRDDIDAVSTNMAGNTGSAFSRP